VRSRVVAFRARPERGGRRRESRRAGECVGTDRRDRKSAASRMDRTGAANRFYRFSRLRLRLETHRTTTTAAARQIRETRCRPTLRVARVRARWRLPPARGWRPPPHRPTARPWAARSRRCTRATTPWSASRRTSGCSTSCARTTRGLFPSSSCGTRRTSPASRLCSAPGRCTCCCARAS
jgi:hypothetical protein